MSPRLNSTDDSIIAIIQLLPIMMHTVCRIFTLSLEFFFLQNEWMQKMNILNAISLLISPLCIINFAFSKFGKWVKFLEYWTQTHCNFFLILAYFVWISSWRKSKLIYEWLMTHHFVREHKIWWRIHRPPLPLLLMSIHYEQKLGKNCNLVGKCTNYFYPNSSL